MIYNNSLEMIGNTPMLKLNNLTNEDMADVYIKLEKFNPGGSIKDRAALGMIEKAEEMGLLKKGDTIVEQTSGNTGIGLAMAGKLKGYKVIIVMPESMSEERRRMIKAYGAELILTEAKYGMKGASDKVEQMARGKKGFFIPEQFANAANAERHYKTTAEEIIKDLPDIDAFVASIGTAGTLMGVSKRLKEFNENIKIIGGEPLKSPLLSKGKAAPHGIQGIGANFIPKLYDESIVDEIMVIPDEKAFKYAKEMGIKEGILVGISSGANIFMALKVAKRLGKGKKVVTVAPDGGEKYLSTGIYD